MTTCAVEVMGSLRWQGASLGVRVSLVFVLQRVFFFVGVVYWVAYRLWEEAKVWWVAYKLLGCVL